MEKKEASTKDSYKDFTNRLGGEVITTNPSTSSCIDPLDIKSLREENNTD